MASLKQIEANRLNARKSTGPRSVEGKAASSMNALKSGIDANAHVIRGENAADLEALTAEYLGRFQPATPEERLHVDTLIRGDWQLRRLARAEAQVWDYGIEYDIRHDEFVAGQVAITRSDTFARLQRRIEAAERSYQRALHELERLRLVRLATNPATELDPTTPPAPQPTAKPIPSLQIGFVPHVPVPEWPISLAPAPDPGPVPNPSGGPQIQPAARPKLS